MIWYRMTNREYEGLHPPFILFLKTELFYHRLFINGRRMISCVNALIAALMSQIQMTSVVNAVQNAVLTNPTNALADAVRTLLPGALTAMSAKQEWMRHETV